jgi:hypothetical protein
LKQYIPLDRAVRIHLTLSDYFDLKELEQNAELKLMYKKNDSSGRVNIVLAKSKNAEDEKLVKFYERTMNFLESKSVDFSTGRSVLSSSPAPN